MTLLFVPGSPLRQAGSSIAENPQGSTLDTNVKVEFVCTYCFLRGWRDRDWMQHLGRQWDRDVPAQCGTGMACARTRR
jgi:hypothetical protein